MIKKKIKTLLNDSLSETDCALLWSKFEPGKNEGMLLEALELCSTLELSSTLSGDLELDEDDPSSELGDGFEEVEESLGLTEERLRAGDSELGEDEAAFELTGGSDEGEEPSDALEFKRC